MQKSAEDNGSRLVVTNRHHPSDQDIPEEAVAKLSLYEVNQDLLQGRIPEVVFLKKGRTVIGRGSQSDVLLNAQRDGKFIISRNHAAFHLSEKECRLEDLGAVNGTYVNGVRIATFAVKTGDIVQFGGMCDIPAGYILEHSDVSVKYRFDFLEPRSYEKESAAASKSIKRNRELSTPAPPAPAVKVQNKKPKVEGREIEGAEPKQPPDDIGSIVLEEIREIKLNQSKEIEGLKAHLQTLQQTISKTEETLARASLSASPRAEIQLSSLPPPVTITAASPAIGRAANPMIVNPLLLRSTSEGTRSEDLGRENQRLREELEALRSARSSEVEPRAADKKPPASSASTASSDGRAKGRGVRERKAAEPRSGEGQKYCQIDVGSLTSHLSCVLCHQLLLDAAVLRCSHGFCRLCLERHLRRGVSTCPICNDPPPSSSSSSFSSGQRQRGLKSKQSSQTSAAVYHRSDQLDALVWIILEASAEEDRQLFRNREKEAADELRGYGIDPHQGYEFAEGAAEEDAAEDSELPPVTCEYCGALDHAEDECPHRPTEDPMDDDEEEEEDV